MAAHFNYKKSLLGIETQHSAQQQQAAAQKNFNYKKSLLEIETRNKLREELGGSLFQLQKIPIRD